MLTFGYLEIQFEIEVKMYEGIQSVYHYTDFKLRKKYSRFLIYFSLLFTD